MKELHFKPFQEVVQYQTTAKTRSRYADSSIALFELTPGKIKALVAGTRLYKVTIDYTDTKVVRLKCDCPYDQEGYCKHIVHVLVEADLYLLNQSEKQDDSGALLRINGYIVLENTPVSSLTIKGIEAISTSNTLSRSYFRETAEFNEIQIGVNQLTGSLQDTNWQNQDFEVISRGSDLLLKCSCGSKAPLLCNHLSFVLRELTRDKDLQLAFDTTLRHQALAAQAEKYGVRDLENPDEFFNVRWDSGRMFYAPKFSILSLNNAKKEQLKQDLLPVFRLPAQRVEQEKRSFLVLQENRYSEQLNFELMEAPLAKNGDLKAPIRTVSLHHQLALHPQSPQTPFLLALLRQQVFEEGATWQYDLQERIQLVKTILSNPMELPFYRIDGKAHHSAKLTPKLLVPSAVTQVDTELTLQVVQRDDFFVLTCQALIANKTFESRQLKRFGGCFIQRGDNYWFIHNATAIRVLDFFTANKHEVFLHKSQFQEFREEFLDRLEQSVTVHYAFVKPAPPKLIREQQLDVVTEHLIYLSESDDFILITPVIRYGEVEIPVLSRRTMYTENPAGGMYSIERNEAAEHRFIRAIQHQHPDFAEMAGQEFYYLHKSHFLDEGWFVDAFENWREQGYVILGFNQLRNNRLNPNKMKVQTRVVSGIDWFDVHASISFGNQEASLKEIQKSVLNKSRYVTLGDGTQGILPQEWLEKFGNYFRSGEIEGDVIRAHKSHFQLIDDLFERDVMDPEVRDEIERYHERMSGFQSIRNVHPPKGLNATLRDYQKEGLNWLHFLNEFGFGGCLADDMGLGKTIQVIAYILSLREQGTTAPNLVVMPTSLLFNWQSELKKFAPELSFIVLHGINREQRPEVLTAHDMVLTTYGTLISDIELLRQIYFDCLVLDESQAIKNTASKRYKAVRLLQGRQRLVMTGTPVENNTFDLYAQLSFVMPGFLGTAKRFADNYATPIDKFQDTQRAQELQRKIHPFVLRRTKNQVARELPEKTEMVIYCEMQSEQRRVYDTYKREFQSYLSGLKDSEVAESSLHILQGMTKLRQICNSPALLSDEAFYGDQSAKLQELMEQLHAIKDDHKVLVFSQFVTMLELIREELEKAGIGYALLTGKTRNRQEQVELFQSDKDVRVFLISLKAGGTGLNLTEADYVFVVDPWWNPAVENQAIDRAYRIGQDKKVVAVRLITPDTIEEKMLLLQERKRELVRDLIHTDTNILKQLSREDLLNLV